MQWLTVVLCVAIGAGWTSGHPQSEEGLRPAVWETPGQTDEDQIVTDYENLPGRPSPDDSTIGKRAADDWEEKKGLEEKRSTEESDAILGKSRSGFEENKLLSSKEEYKNLNISGAKLVVKFPEETKQSVVQDDVVRTKKSPQMSPQMSPQYHRRPHTTTVCIQLQNDNHQVVCGPQAGQSAVIEQKEEPKARFAYQPTLSSAEQFYTGYASGPPQERFRYVQPPPLLRREQYSSSVMLPSLPRAASPQFARRPVSVPLVPSVLPARRYPVGYSVLRSEEEARPIKPVEEVHPQPAHPGFVSFDRQYYSPPPQYVQPAMMSYASLPAAMRLNCIQSDHRFMSPYLRSSVAPGYFPMEEHLMGGALPRSSLEDSQFYYAPSQARAASAYSGSPYADSSDAWLGAAVLGEDGQAYLLEDAAGFGLGQARSAAAAAGDLWEQQFFQRAAANSDSNLESKEQQLLQSQEKLKLLQQQVNILDQQKASNEKRDQTIAASIPKANGNSGLETSIIVEQNKAAKRQIQRPRQQ